MNYKGEEFILIHNGRYYKKYINSKGLILTVNNKGLIKEDYGCETVQGYLTTTANLYGGTNIKVHRIVALLFIGEPPDDERIYIDHIDTNRKNNSCDNLRWVTRKENMNNEITKINMSKNASKKYAAIVDGKKIIKNSRRELIEFIRREFSIPINKDWFYRGVARKYKNRISNLELV